MQWPVANAINGCASCQLSRPLPHLMPSATPAISNPRCLSAFCADGCMFLSTAHQACSTLLADNKTDAQLQCVPARSYLMLLDACRTNGAQCTTTESVTGATSWSHAQSHCGRAQRCRYCCAALRHCRRHCLPCCRCCCGGGRRHGCCGGGAAHWLWLLLRVLLLSPSCACTARVCA